VRQFFDLILGADGARDEPDANTERHDENEQDQQNYYLFHNRVPSLRPRRVPVRACVVGSNFTTPLYARPARERELIKLPAESVQTMPDHAAARRSAGLGPAYGLRTSTRLTLFALAQPWSQFQNVAADVRKLHIFFSLSLVTSTAMKF
jgi:hypothetical protein